MSELISIPTLAEMNAKNETPDVLFWVGCAGSFDDRAKKITKAFARLLMRAEIKFAVLGAEESCSGDPARRAGNEFLYQMQALANIETLNTYKVQRIVTTCPHCFNTLKNEYPVFPVHLGLIPNLSFCSFVSCSSLSFSRRFSLRFRFILTLFYSYF